jgi:poly [ADP-ribose] polymerase
MSMTTRSATLVLVDTKANSNKFYRMSLDANGTVTTTYGRVGAAGVTNTEHTGIDGYERILHAKKRKGYQEIDVADDTVKAAPRVASHHLATVAKTGLTSGKARENTIITDLIERIVAVNAHDILSQSGGLIKVDTSGRIKTPLGLVTSRSIAEAGRVLNQIETSTPTELGRLLEQYLTFVPQKVGRLKGWEDTFFDANNTIARQREFLGQLRDSLNFYDAQAIAAAEAPGAVEADAGFKYKLRAIADTGAVFARIKALYEGSKNASHTSTSLRLKRVFELVDPIGAKAYAGILADIGNEQHLWHGTKAANLLSILRKGLYVPPTSGTSIQTNGRMFGDGVYLSNQSTKSLNYSSGFWSNGRSGGSSSSNCFMLLNDVAMGSEYRPTYGGFDARIPKEARTTLNKFGKNFNSINVRAGHGGIRNHEAIVWNADQVRVRYLVEFGA